MHPFISQFTDCANILQRIEDILRAEGIEATTPEIEGIGATYCARVGTFIIVWSIFVDTKIDGPEDRRTGVSIEFLFPSEEDEEPDRILELVYDPKDSDAWYVTSLFKSIPGDEKEQRWHIVAPNFVSMDKGLEIIQNNSHHIQTESKKD